MRLEPWKPSDLEGYSACSGRISAYFSAPRESEEYEDHLKSYVTTKSAVHLPLDRDTPILLIKKFVQARVKMNDEEADRRKYRRRSSN
jgi:hypothetical protein